MKRGWLKADFYGILFSLLRHRRVTQRCGLLALRVCLLRGGVFTLTVHGRGERERRPGLEMMTDYNEKDGNAAQRSLAVCLTSLWIAAFCSSLVQPSSPALKRVNLSVSALGWVPLLCYFFTVLALYVLGLILVFCYSQD